MDGVKGEFKVTGVQIPSPDNFPLNKDLNNQGIFIFH